MLTLLILFDLKAKRMLLIKTEDELGFRLLLFLTIAVLFPFIVHRIIPT